MLEIFGTEQCITCSIVTKIAREQQFHYVFKNVTYKKYYNELKNRMDIEIDKVPYVFFNGNLIGHHKEFVEWVRNYYAKS